MSDYISRQAAFEALEKRGVSTTNISRVPIADVRENVRGEWQVVGYDKKYIPIVYTCSVCGFRTTMELEFDFCPNCGADMRSKS